MQQDDQSPQPTAPNGPDVSGAPMGQRPYTIEQSAVPAAPAQPFAQPQALNPQPAAAPGAWTPPAAPTAPAAPVAPAAHPGFMPGAVTQPSRSRKLPMLPLAIAGGVLVLAAAAFAVFKFVLSAVTLEDVTEARTSYNSLSDNVYEASTAARGLDAASTTSEFESKLKVFEAKLADAEKEYSELKGSAVQHNGKVHEKFAAFDKKWKPYVDFLRANVKDAQALLPIQIDFESRLDDLSGSSYSTNAELSNYLTSFKQLIDDTSADLEDVKLSLEENQKMLKALQEFLTTASDLVSSAQSDLAAGASTYKVASHIYDISSASYDMNDELYSLQDQLYDKGKLLDPASEFDEFGDSLQSLYRELSE